MEKYCAWCGIHLGTIEAVGKPGMVSHGICIECAEKLFQENPLQIQYFLNRFEIPILLVDDDCRVISANDRALELTCQSLECATGRLAGDVMECKHAKAGGCGKTVHCKACAIRNSVTHTHQTGETLYRIPAFQNLIQGDREIKVRFLISTEKIKDVVILKIEEVSGVQQGD
ncbi:MAG: hypothetical protein GC154_10995 [bacterium]|nr:hypothetical protein [bacterium]